MLGTLKNSSEHDNMAAWLGTFLVGVDVDGTLDMRPGPIAKKYLGLNFGPETGEKCRDAQRAESDIFFRYLSGWFIPDLLILMIDIVLFILTSQLDVQFRLFGGPGLAWFRDAKSNSTKGGFRELHSTSTAHRFFGAALATLVRKQWLWK